MANINAMIVAQIKVKLAEARSQVEKYEVALAAFGGTAATPKSKAAKGGGGRGKPVAAIQAAADARAVKAGNATPEQYARYHDRQNAKAAKEAAKAKTTEEVVSGANLAAAAS